MGRAARRGAGRARHRPAHGRYAGGPWLFDFVFVLVVIFTIVQGPTLPWVARRLGLTDAAFTVDVEVESTPLEEMGADLLQVQIGARSQLHGVELFELRLPAGANVTLVVRDDKGFVPSPDTRCAPRRPAARSSPPPRPAGLPSSGCARSASTGAWPAGRDRARAIRGAIRPNGCRPVWSSPLKGSSPLEPGGRHAGTWSPVTGARARA